MADWKKVREFALALPEVGEEPHFDRHSWRVRRKIFATFHEGRDTLNVFLDEEDARMLAEALPAVCEELWWGKRLYGVRLNLKVAEDEQVLTLLEKAWRRRAPKKLIEAYEERAAG